MYSMKYKKVEPYIYITPEMEMITKLDQFKCMSSEDEQWWPQCTKNDRKFIVYNSFSCIT